MVDLLAGMDARLKALFRTDRQVMIGTCAATGFMEMAVRSGVRHRMLSLVGGAFGKRFAAVAKGTEIKVMKIPPRSPNLNPVCERFLGSVRRECLDHMVILSERQLRGVLKEYVEIYFNRARPHQGLRHGIPVAESRLVPKVGGKVLPIPILGGLHHDYRWAA